MAVAEDAIDNYLLWELCKQEGIQNMVMEGSAEEGKLKEIVEKVEMEYRENQYGLEEKKKKLRDLDSNPDYRLEVFEDCSWRKETVEIEDLGTTLPRAGDLPPGIIAGKLSDVLEFVQQADPDEYQSVKYIMRLKQVPEVLNEFYPWILTPGKRKSKRDRMNGVHGEKDWDIKDTWGMINDGNHRTIARILASDSKEIKCYVGHRRES
jgi:hypothetical protein